MCIAGIDIHSGSDALRIAFSGLYTYLQPVGSCDIVAVYKGWIFYVVDDEIKVTIKIQVCISRAIGK